MTEQGINNFMKEAQEHYIASDEAAMQFAAIGDYIGQVRDMRENPERGDYTFWARSIFFDNFFDLGMEKEVWAALYRLISKHRNVFIACLKEVGFKKNGYACDQRVWTIGTRILYKAALGGSRTAKDTMARLYKEFYSDEYLALKNSGEFSVNALNHITSAADKGTEEIHKMCCRLLCMAEVMDLAIDYEYADRVYGLSKYALEAPWSNPTKIEIEKESFTVKGLPDKRELEAGTKFVKDIFISDATMKNLLNKDLSFVEQALNICGYRQTAASVLEKLETDKMLGYVGAILKRIFPNKTAYSKSEAALYCTLILVTRAMADHNNAAYSFVNEILNQIKNEDDTAEEPEYVSFTSSAGISVPEPDANTLAADEAARQIEDLKRTVARLESEVSEYREQAAGERRRAEKVSQELEELKDDTADVAALRSFVYNMTETDHPATDNLEEKKKKIRDMKVIVVGGHPNWVKKVQPEFPGWRFVARKMSSTADVDAVAHIDYLLFNTDSLGHKDYYRWINEARRLGVNIGYLSGMNLQNTIRQAYEVLTA